MKAENFIASRLRFKGRLATVAITVSFFVMILSIAISAGFRTEIRRGLSELSGDILLSGSEEPVNTAPSCLEQLEAMEGVSSIRPVIWKPGIVKGGSDIAGVIVKGVPMPADSSLKARIPRALAERMQLSLGDSFTTWFVDERAKARRFTVSEIYDGITASDNKMIMEVPLADMQRVYGWSADEASALEVMLKTGYKEEPRLSATANALTWISLENHDEEEDILRAATSRQRYSQIYDWLDLIDFNVLAILLLMTVVAGFNMVSGLLILLFRSVSTIGILKSMGMGDRSIARVFLLVAARIVSLGALAGSGAALAFCLLEDRTHLFRLNPANYFLSYVPAHVDAGTVLLVNLLAFAAIMLLLLIPTLFISRVDPAKTVRVK